MMTISMNAKNNKKVRPGVALLVVLFIVMAITILSLGFVSRSDVELACGQNMILRTQMDYLAESGLEHARGLILNPQDTASEDWTAASQQLVAGSGDYYDLVVVRDNSDPTDRCNYIIDCNSYRLEGIEKIGLSRLHAELRLDPCIAYWAGSDTTVSTKMVINGDVYCTGDLTNNGIIGGDVFATGTITGANIEGQKNTVTQAPVTWPNLAVTDFKPTYYIGSTSYSAQQIVDANIPTPSVLPGVWYSNGDVNMPGNVTVNGTLVVDGTLRISGVNNVITAEPNFPALLVAGQVVMEDGSSLVVNGLAQIEGPITVDPNTISSNITVTGGLFINNGGAISDKVSVDITAAPAITAIEIWSDDNTARRWSSAGGAFFRSIERIK